MMLLIPSATLVPKELQKIGKLPAVIYPVDEKIVYDYVYEQYGSISSKVTVVCYQGAEKIHNRLSDYKQDNLNIVDLPELGDLGHTIYYGLGDYPGEVIINFADTIVDEDISLIRGDAFYYAEDEISPVWTFYREEKGVIREVLDKKEGDIRGIASLFVGVFKISNASEFKRCLKTAFENSDISVSSFYRALMLYSEIYPMKAVKTDNWFDIGHLDKYFDSQLEVKARRFNHITIDKNRSILKKTSEDKKKFIGEIFWYLKLPCDIEYVRPRIFSYSTNYSDPFIKMEYYAYHTVHEMFLYGDLAYDQWRRIFKKIKFICNDFLKYTVKDKRIKPALESMYLTKTLKRIQEMEADADFAGFFEQEYKINGIEYISLSDIVDKLRDCIPAMLYDVERFSIIHGDLCFTNIMIDGNFNSVKVIDPRGRFGDFDIYGDVRYELAKLFHSVDGKYDFIIKDLFSIKVDVGKRNIQYQVNDRNRDFDLYEIFISEFKDYIGNDQKKIELIEALLFFSMIPLHGESKNHQFAMLATGTQILDRVINIQYLKQ